MLMSMSSKSDEVKYSEVMGHFDALEVSEFQLDLGSGELKYKLKDAPDEEKIYKVPNVSLFVNEVLGGEKFLIALKDCGQRPVVFEGKGVESPIL